MNIDKIIFSLLFIGFGVTVFAQKIERETRIDEESVPLKAVEYLSDVQEKKQMKWYREETSGRKSYESKFKYKGKFYSVEFDTLGNIEDIEVIVKLKDIDQNHKSALKRGVLNEFEKFKWIKIQKQYTGDENDLKQVFSEITVNVELNYEIEVEVKTKEGVWKMYEILLSPSGQVENMREILLRPTDNLNY